MARVRGTIKLHTAPRDSTLLYDFRPVQIPVRPTLRKSTFKRAEETRDNSQHPAMERKSFLCLVLAATSGLTSPTAEFIQPERDLTPRDPAHRTIVEIAKFAQDIALDVQANRNLTERSNAHTEDIANAIIQHVNDLNEKATTTFEATLVKLSNAMHENMKRIVDQTREKRGQDFTSSNLELQRPAQRDRSQAYTT